MKPRNWIPVGWIPCYDESRDKRRKTGFESTSARKIRLYHQCWLEFLDGWAKRTKDAMLLPWADGVTRSTRLFIGGVMGDQQEGDKYTGEPCLCHRCYAPRKRYLDTDADFEVKTMRKVRQRVEFAAAGGFAKDFRVLISSFVIFSRALAAASKIGMTSLKDSSQTVFMARASSLGMLHSASSLRQASFFTLASASFFFKF